MEYYDFWNVLYCLVPLIAAFLLLAHYQGRTKPQKGQSEAPSENELTAEDLIINESDQSCLSNPFNSLFDNLKKVNLYDPQTRPEDSKDRWFKKHTAELMHDIACVAYIACYGHLENTFWKNIEALNLEPQNDFVFQKLIASVHCTPWGICGQNCSNLLFSFGTRWKLLPCIAHIIETDPRFDSVKTTYEVARRKVETEESKVP